MTLPKLNLRELFWLVIVVAMGLGWWKTGESLRVEHSMRIHAEANRDGFAKEAARMAEWNAEAVKQKLAIENDNVSLQRELEQARKRH
jgi:hypothetical protein